MCHEPDVFIKEVLNKPKHSNSAQKVGHSHPCPPHRCSASLSKSVSSRSSSKADSTPETHFENFCFFSTFIYSFSPCDPHPSILHPHCSLTTFFLREKKKKRRDHVTLSGVRFIYYLFIFAPVGWLIPGVSITMKLFLDSSSSLLLSLLLAQLPLFTSTSPLPLRRPTEMDKLSNQTKNLMKLTQELLREHAFDSDVEPHRFRSLPEMSNRSANDFTNLELKPTLSQLHADLKLYEHHFEWLNRVSKKHHHPALPKLMEMIREMKSLMNLLHRQMQRVEAPRLTPATPSLPPHLPYHFDVLQSTHELLQHFKLFCDWAYRAFISLKPKVSAARPQPSALTEA